MSAAVQATIRPTVVQEPPKEKSISDQFQKSNLKTFGEFKISERIKDKIAHGRDSLSEGKYHPETPLPKSPGIHEKNILGEIPPQSMATNSSLQ